MPTVLSHPAVALGLAPWYRELRRHPAVIVTGMMLTVLPDLDVMAFSFGIPYAHALGHRGLTHSLPFALVVSFCAAALVSWRTRLSIRLLWSYFALSMASHGVLDAFTDGGLGIALLAPFSNERFFFAWHPIQVSPLGIERFLSARGAVVIKNELLWVWLPCAGLGLAGLLWPRLRRRLSPTLET